MIKTIFMLFLLISTFDFIKMGPIDQTEQMNQTNSSTSQTNASDHVMPPPQRRSKYSRSFGQNPYSQHNYGQNQFMEQFFGRQYGTQDPFQCSSRCSNQFLNCWNHVAFGGHYGNKNFEVCNEQQTKCNAKCF